jgi:SpoIIAA-like
VQKADFTCSVAYDVDVPCVVMTWTGYATSAQFRESNERVLACVKQHRAHRLLGDVSDFVLIGASDQNWLNEEWIPRAIEVGLRRAAIVQPTSYFNRVAIENVRRRIDPERLAVGYFDTLDKAREWLRSNTPA